ncbi:MAG: hypothetical protein K0S45_3644 [Nitrospira sp.]|nr:hypothetical protein [Nitrospira sp.]
MAAHPTIRHLFEYGVSGERSLWRSQEILLAKCDMTSLIDAQADANACRRQ